MAQYFGGGFSSMPPVTKNLIIINVLIWLVEIFFPQFGVNGIIRHLALHYVEGSHFNPAQIITYMFVHDRGNFFHILFNMWTLFFFGPWLERKWGSKRFLIFYFICGIGAAIIQECAMAYTYYAWQSDDIQRIADTTGFSVAEITKEIQNAISSGDTNIIQILEANKNAQVTMGASGAIFGLLLGFAFVFPNLPLYFFFVPVPIKAKYMVIGYAVIELLLGVTGSLASVAHYAHLGGMLFGLPLLLYWKHNHTLHGPNHFRSN